MPHYQIPLHVNAGDKPRVRFPVVAHLDLAPFLQGQALDANSVRVADEAGYLLPAQFVPTAESQGEVWFRHEAGQRLVLSFATREEASTPPPDFGTSVRIREDRAVLDVLMDDAPFTVYNYGSTHATLWKPFFYPILGPTGHSIVQNGEFPGTLRGHYWHRALFIAHQKVNGTSFWEEREEDCGRILHVKFDQIISGPVVARFTHRTAWRKPNGMKVLDEVRTVTIPHAPRERRFMDIETSLTPAGGDVLFEATPYHLLACRVANSMCLAPQKHDYTERLHKLVDFGNVEDGGRIINSEGQEDRDCLGATAHWCDFSGPLNGTWCGVALFDHPDNPRHPTAWNNWNNMTIAAAPTFHEPYTLPAGETLRLKYRVYFHAGNHEEAEVEAQWREFAETVKVRAG
jgi:hypothetical protein